MFCGRLWPKYGAPRISCRAARAHLLLLTIVGIYDLGMVNHAHMYPDGTDKAHMYTHVYHEGVARKASNNVASLIMKTFRHIIILCDDKMGG